MVTLDKGPRTPRFLVILNTMTIVRDISYTKDTHNPNFPEPPRIRDR